MCTAVQTHLITRHSTQDNLDVSHTNVKSDSSCVSCVDTVTPLSSQEGWLLNEVLDANMQQQCYSLCYKCPDNSSPIVCGLYVALFKVRGIMFLALHGRGKV